MDFWLTRNLQIKFIMYKLFIHNFLQRNMFKWSLESFRKKFALVLNFVGEMRQNQKFKDKQYKILSKGDYITCKIYFYMSTFTVLHELQTL